MIIFIDKNQGMNKSFVRMGYHFSLRESVCGALIKNISIFVSISYLDEEDRAVLILFMYVNHTA